MTQEVLLWIGGIAAAIIGTLGLVLLRRVLDALDRVDKKVTAQGESFARLETNVGHLTTDVRSLNTWRQDVSARALAAAEQRAIEAERRLGPADRRNVP